MTVRDYLIRRGIEFRMRGNEAICNCPFCKDTENKFAINVNSGAFRCLHENRCGVKGSFWEFQRMMGDEPRKLYDKDPYIPKKKSYKKVSVSVTKTTDNVNSYLKSRGFTEETIKHFRIGSKDQDTVAIPYFKNGELVNVKYRNIKEKSKMWQEKEAEQVLLNRDNLTSDRIIICEGEYDCMALWQYGVKDAVSVPSGAGNFDWVENEWEFLDSFSNVIICFDNDSAGIEKSNELVQKIGNWKCKGVVLPFKDANECLMKGVPKEKIIDLIENAKDFAPAIIVRPSNHRESIKDGFRNPLKKNGMKTAFPKLTDLLGGWRDSELTVWTGRSGAGKSTILNQVFLGIAGEGTKSCIASLEMPAEDYLSWAIVQFLGNYHPSDYSIDQALDFMDKWIYVVDTHEEIKECDLLDVFEYAARKNDCKHFIIDSLMRVILKEKDELLGQKAFVSKLMSFAKKFKCHVHLVAHPRKGMKDSDRPDKSDVKGSSSITDIADNVLSLWRPEDDEVKKDPLGDVLLSVLKNRRKGDRGKIKLTFDKLTKRFSDGSKDGLI